MTLHFQLYSLECRKWSHNGDNTIMVNELFLLAIATNFRYSIFFINKSTLLY